MVSNPSEVHWIEMFYSLFRSVFNGIISVYSFWFSQKSLHTLRLRILVFTHTQPIKMNVVIFHFIFLCDEGKENKKSTSTLIANGGWRHCCYCGFFSGYLLCCWISGDFAEKRLQTLDILSNNNNSSSSARDIFTYFALDPWNVESHLSSCNVTLEIGVGKNTGMRGSDEWRKANERDRNMGNKAMQNELNTCMCDV